MIKEIDKWLIFLNQIEKAEVTDIITVIPIIKQEFDQFEECFILPPLSPLKIGVNLKSIKLLRILSKLGILDRNELVETYSKETIELAIQNSTYPKVT